MLRPVLSRFPPDRLPSFWARNSRRRDLHPPIKVFEKGVEKKDVFELVWNNVRWPEGVRVDNYALIAATKICEKRLLALVDKYGRDTVMDCVEEMIGPLERGPAKVQADFLNGMVSLKAAREVYGVVLNPDTLELDHTQTALLREKQRPGTS